MINAPIVLFTYLRLDVLKQTVNALKSNELACQSNLFIFSDAAKHEQDEPIVREIRAYIKQIEGFKSITISEAAINKGLANSIIDGVSEIIEKYGQVIVLEDDLITTPNFLLYMNQALSYFKDRKEIFSISGYNYDFKVPEDFKYDNYCATRGCSWGWATWEDRWQVLNWDISSYKGMNNKDFRKSFNYSGSDLYSMLMKQKRKEIDSWAIRWYYNQWEQSKLTVYPTRSLVNNKGFDDYATHTHVYDRYKSPLMLSDKASFNFGSSGKSDPYYQEQIRRKFSIITRIFWGRVMTFLKNVNVLK